MARSTQMDNTTLKNLLEDPSLAAAYAGLALEDTELAEQGIAEYGDLLREADCAAFDEE